MFLVTREALSLMKNASIINISSRGGRTGGHSGSLFYSSVKGAMITMTKGLTKELATYGIRVNAVAPGMILGTRIQASHISDKLEREVILNTPLGRAGKCEDVARAVVFLSSEYNGFITGTTLDINGGINMIWYES